MKKEDLKKMIRYQIREELYAVLPKLLEEAMQNVIRKNNLVTERSRSNVGSKTKRQDRPKPTGEHFDRNKLASLIGYETPPKSSVKLSEIAGVPMASGLRAHEADAGQLQYRDYNDSMSEIPTDNDAVPVSDVPVSVVQALGMKAKKVLDETNRRTNWRPGK